MKYTVIYSTQLDNMIDDVNTALDGGYKCLGGLVVYRDAESNVIYAQTLVKE